MREGSLRALFPLPSPLSPSFLACRCPSGPDEDHGPRHGWRRDERASGFAGARVVARRAGAPDGWGRVRKRRRIHFAQARGGRRVELAGGREAGQRTPRHQTAGTEPPETRGREGDGRLRSGREGNSPLGRTATFTPKRAGTGRPDRRVETLDPSERRWRARGTARIRTPVRPCPVARAGVEA